jgi:hypothetical protein
MATMHVGDRVPTAIARLVLFGSVVLGSCGSTTAPTLSAGLSEPAATTAQPPSTDGPRSAEPPASSATAASCTDGGPLPHQAPDLEAVLPAQVGGRSLARWSLRGRCWLEETAGKENVDSVIGEFDKMPGGGQIDVSNLKYGIAGRADTKRDPPFFVFGAGRPRDEREISLALYLMLGGAAFHNVAEATDLSRYRMQAIGGKRVAVGTEAMLDQNEHQRGRPYLYQTDDYMFLIITDDDAWAADALRQLP